MKTKSMLSELQDEIDHLESKTVTVTIIKKEVLLTMSVTELRELFYDKFYPLFLEAQERK